MSKLSEILADKFVVIDGPDGAGKSTQLRMLAEHLKASDVEVVQTRDPGGTAIGDKIRHILLDNDHTAMTIGCEILLYMASRTQLMGEVIQPALSAGKCVLCDRWVSSTVAYQVAEGAATADEIMSIYNTAMRGVFPDLTVIVDLPAERGLDRVGDAPDRIEAKGAEFHSRVRELFLQQAADSPENFAVIDATGSIEQVHERLRDIILNWSFAE